MANLTISVDDETLRRARIRALERGDSVNRVLAERLREYAGTTDEERLARQRATLAALQSHARSVGKGGHDATFNRDDVYTERLGRYDR